MNMQMCSIQQNYTTGWGIYSNDVCKVYIKKSICGDVIEVNMQMGICNITIIRCCVYTIMMSARYTENRRYAVQSIHVHE